MIIKPTRRIATVLAVAGAAAALSAAGATSASASQYTPSITLQPGQGVCTGSQYAGYQAQGVGTATRDGAKFKLLRNGVVIANTANRATYAVLEVRSSWGTFPGPGSYSFCAQNTGTLPTTVTLTLKTDSEF